MKLTKSREILENALQAEQMSAYGLGLRLGKEQNFFFGGQHARPALLASPLKTGADSIFDLASVTKIFVTVCLLHRLRAQGVVDFNKTLRHYLPDFSHEKITLLQILTHHSGLPAHIEFFKRYQAGEAAMGDVSAVVKWIYQTPLREGELKTEYSDLGFILLGVLLEKLYQKPLAQIFSDEIATPLGLQRSGYIPLTHSKYPGLGLKFSAEHFIATEECPWRKKILQGEVHDDNCWSMGGVAGHAGLFSTTAESLQMLDALVQGLSFPSADTRASFNLFHEGFMVYPGLRAHPSQDFAGALGHSGYTGTSAWHHPGKDLSVVLLSNRVHPSRADSRWIATRLQFHEALWNELFS